MNGAKVIIKIFQRCMHLLYCVTAVRSVEVGGNVNT